MDAKNHWFKRLLGTGYLHGHKIPPYDYLIKWLRDLSVPSLPNDQAGITTTGEQTYMPTEVIKW